MKWWDKEIKKPEEAVIRTPQDYTAEREAWWEEWRAARDAAIAAVTPGSPFLIWQNTENGWWRVGYWLVDTVPAYMGQFESYLDYGKKPSMKVEAFDRHQAFAVLCSKRTKDSARAAETGNLYHRNRDGPPMMEEPG